MAKSKNDKIKYLVYSVLGVLIIVYFISNIVKMNVEPYKTEVAFKKDIQSTINTKAFIIRDEEYITASATGGTPVSVAEDGKRVASGDAVAVVFPTPESAASYVRSNELKKEIDYCKQLQNRVGVGTNAPSSYNDLIDKTCLDFIKASKDGIGADYHSKLVDFRDAVTARKLAVGEKISVEERLKQLQGEYDALQASASTYSVIESPNSGYYIGSVDGYEKLLAYDDAKKPTCEQIDSLINSSKQSVPENVMGKLVDEFNWYILCNIPYNSSGGIVKGDTLYVNISNTSVSKIGCTVEYKGVKEGENVPVVLKCNVMNRNVANLRIEDIEIITDEYEGIKISNKAIREENGEKGVYVAKGNIVQFKKIKIVESNEDNSIVEIVDDSSYLRQYDEIITEGVDLYDGKVIS